MELLHGGALLSWTETVKTHGTVEMQQAPCQIWMPLKGPVFSSSSSPMLSFFGTSADWNCTREESCADDWAEAVWDLEVVLNRWDSQKVHQSRCFPLLIKVLWGVTYVWMFPLPTRSSQKATVEKQLPSSRLQTFYPPSVMQIKAVVTSLKWNIWVVKVKAKEAKLVLFLAKVYYHSSENCQWSQHTASYINMQ